MIKGIVARALYFITGNSETSQKMREALGISCEYHGQGMYTLEITDSDIIYAAATEGD